MKLYGLLGEKLGHSYSQPIHEEVMGALGVTGNYAIMEIARENIPHTVNALKVLGYRGVNITVPYKQVFLADLDLLSPEAETIGAINTIDFQDGKVTGYNTDYFGFGRMLAQKKIEVAGQSVVLLGAGGTANAIIAYAKAQGAKEIKVFLRDEQKAAGLMEKFPFIKCLPLAEKHLIKGDILVNATPVGMWPGVDDCLLDETQLTGFTAVVDCIYNPVETKLIQRANTLGIKVCTGLWMLVYQAVKAQEIWQKKEVDEDIAKKIYDKVFAMLAE